MTNQCQNCKTSFEIAEDDLNFYDKISVPSPTWCPECRLVRRLLWRNERYLYKRTCGLCGKGHISMYPEDSPYTVYCPSCWYSDKWDPLEYGKPYDFSRPFFGQFKDLMLRVPLLSLWVSYPTLVNSDYNNLAGKLKNCYMLFHADSDEGCSYGSGVKFSKDSIDTTMLQRSELCYECVNVVQGYRNFFCVDCENSQNIYFSKNCINCSNCIGCANLRNKKHHIFNEPHSKEEYEQKLEEFDLASHRGIQTFRRRAHEFWTRFPVKAFHGRHNTNSSGDYIFTSKNVRHSYEIVQGEDCAYSQFASSPTTRDAYDYTEWGEGAELMYESILCGRQVSRLKFTAHGEASRDVEYSFLPFGSAYLFGCVAVKNGRYCILNKQYSKEEYEETMSKIKKHMDDVPYTDGSGRLYRYGEFFPAEISPHAYNESTPQELFPLSERAARERGYRWKSQSDKPYEPTVSWKDLPDKIHDADERFLNEVVLCQAWDEDVETAKEHNCTKAFRLTNFEFQFYKKMNLPLPRKCHNSRHFDRIRFRNPIKFWHRRCACLSTESLAKAEAYRNAIPHFHGDNPCPNEFETSYAPERPEIVYCEACYNQEVI